MAIEPHCVGPRLKLRKDIRIHTSGLLLCWLAKVKGPLTNKPVRIASGDLSFLICHFSFVISHLSFLICNFLFSRNCCRDPSFSLDLHSYLTYLLTITPLSASKSARPCSTPSERGEESYG